MSKLKTKSSLKTLPAPLGQLTIVVGGRNKYLINGKASQPNQVLNMKPPEILSMLEEAAGTRMYETKKEAALKTLEDRLRRFCIAYEYVQAEKIRDSAVDDVEQVKEDC
ncbi:hypothetical protein EZV62_005600 [Acer yangbiense]|uniref:Uncharacterized protein n=1 Tax=Acer yangbiense TaxID=1000413 RepID=A0A5C7IN91_9ROSI|nr:hypothetical protein EZV62_005600 [Acer yangbiense]